MFALLLSMKTKKCSDSIKTNFEFLNLSLGRAILGAWLTLSTSLLAGAAPLCAELIKPQAAQFIIVLEGDPIEATMASETIRQIKATVGPVEIVNGARDLTFFQQKYGANNKSNVFIFISSEMKLNSWSQESGAYLKLIRELSQSDLGLVGFVSSLKRMKDFITRPSNLNFARTDGLAHLSIRNLRNSAIRFESTNYFTDLKLERIGSAVHIPIFEIYGLERLMTGIEKDSDEVKVASSLIPLVLKAKQAEPVEAMTLKRGINLHRTTMTNSIFYMFAEMSMFPAFNRSLTMKYAKTKNIEIDADTWASIYRSPLVERVNGTDGLGFKSEAGKELSGGLSTDSSLAISAFLKENSKDPLFAKDYPHVQEISYYMQHHRSAKAYRDRTPDLTPAELQWLSRLIYE